MLLSLCPSTHATRLFFVFFNILVRNTPIVNMNLTDFLFFKKRLQTLWSTALLIYTFKTVYKKLYIFLTYLRLGYALDRLVSVSYMCYHTSTSDLSTSSSSRGLTTYVGISHLEGGFTLRCLQRLSLPGLATLPCSW